MVEQGAVWLRGTSGARWSGGVGGRKAEEHAVRPERERDSSLRLSSGAAAPRLLGLQR